MAKAYKTLANEPQFGGAMTWDLSYDYDNKYAFAKAMKPVLDDSEHPDKMEFLN